ncbi:MAG: carboxymuconolactone decarboxylase family protein [Novosphingobium sp.]
MNERFEKGEQLMTAMMGPEFAAQMRAGATSGGFGADVARFAIEHAFGDVWSRPGLARKHRSMVVISALIASGHSDELRNHVRFGLRNGVTPDELQEVLIQCLPYVGFPAISGAIRVMIEVLRETGQDGGAATAKERGIL